MSDFLTRIIDRAFEPSVTVQPRPRARFEPPQIASGTPSWAAEPLMDASLDVDDAQAAPDPAGELPQTAPRPSPAGGAPASPPDVVSRHGLPAPAADALAPSPAIPPALEQLRREVADLRRGQLRQSQLRPTPPNALGARPVQREAGLPGQAPSPARVERSISDRAVERVAAGPPGPPAPSVAPARPAIIETHAAAPVSNGPLAPRRETAIAVQTRVAPAPIPQAGEAGPAAAEPAPPTVTIHIGRIEVRAAPPAGPATPARPNQAPALSLDDYLRKRNGESR